MLGLANTNHQLAVIIPTLNAAEDLLDTLRSLVGLPIAELIVVDGASSDGTCALATNAGATVLSSARGRGVQLAAGAEASQAPWLLFLHADTRLDERAVVVVRDFIAAAVMERAGYFRFRLDHQDFRARLVECWVYWRCCMAALPYGDQGLLIARSLYQQVGGYPPWPLMEDVALVERLGRKRLCALPATAITSACRYQHSGYLARGLRNIICYIFYRLGVDPQRIVHRYEGKPSSERLRDRQSR